MAGFINPYNFVRWLEDRNGEPICPEKKEPLTHEKFSGLSGTIVCEMETLTPVCVPDSENTSEEILQTDPPKPRAVKPFCRAADSNPFIPGSELKGVIRSVAEAASNSCFSVLTHQMAIFRDNRRHIPGGTLLALMEIEEDEENDTRQAPSNQRGNRLSSLDQLRTAYNLPDVKSNKYGVKLTPPKAEVPIDRDGMFFQPIRNKHRTYPNALTSDLDVSDAILNAHRDMVKDTEFKRVPIGQSESNAQTPNDLERQILTDYKNEKHNGNYWFVRTRQDSNGRQVVVTLGRNFRHKWAYRVRGKEEKSNDDETNYHPGAVPKEFEPCVNPDLLCPCCSMFGMAEDRTGEDNRAEEKVNAFAGKVSIGPAAWHGGLKRFEWIADHRILNTPKFSCRSFYLKPSQPQKFDVSQDDFIDEEGATNRARGRKFYWHHTKTWNGQSIDYFERRKQLDGQKPDETDQNSRIETLMPGAVFRFNIDFENLTEFELGLLLWTLELPGVEEGAHHVGLGKPIGLGSVKIGVKQVSLIDRNKRYKSLLDLGIETFGDNGGEADLQGEPLAGFLNAFRAGMEQQGGSDFAKLSNISDLLKILSTKQPGPAGRDAPISYPIGPNRLGRGDDNKGVHPNELHYLWFTQKSWREPLRTIQEIAGESKTNSLIEPSQGRR